MAIDVALRPNKTALLFRNFLTARMVGIGGPVSTRNPGDQDRGDQWIRCQAMPYHQVNELEFENPCMLHAYDLDEERGLETIDQIAARVLEARQIHINDGVRDIFVADSGIDIGYTVRVDPELIQYSRYQMTAFFCTKGTPLV
jgi:hypothetical protein